ncbi:CLUMA_CG014092, isoform A [Clunio marinus]|uniref:CLUMA_CG014092, isoform A n=1 Tax=Clunio marinus TaxID=568069 RepID=A0A1J1IQT2_9DIPT|nr:CLUMA_CG014092, isoform A [Clunio marinus]
MVPTFPFYSSTSHNDIYVYLINTQNNYNLETLLITFNFLDAQLQAVKLLKATNKKKKSETQNKRNDQEKFEEITFPWRILNIGMALVDEERSV